MKACRPLICFNYILFIYMKEQGPWSVKASDYNITKKELLLAALGVCIFVFGTQGEFRDLLEFLIFEIRAYNEGCFFFSSWIMD